MGRLRHLEGCKFGKLTVIELVGKDKWGSALWKCKCDCGNETIKTGGSLFGNKTKSCGCSSGSFVSERLTKNLINKKFGKLTVVERVGSTIHRSARWRCECDCGNEIYVAGMYLINGHTRSCGCLQGETVRKSYGEASINALYLNYSRRAEKCGYVFELTKDEFKVLISGDCYYCGHPPAQQQHRPFNGNVVYNGVDRVDSSVGYVLNNVVTCCGKCNRAKFTYTVDEFRAYIKSTYEYMFSRSC